MKKMTIILLIITIFLNTISLVSAVMIYTNSEGSIKEIILNDDDDEIKKIFEEIKEIHKIKYNNKILGYNWYIRNDKEYYEIIHDYAPNDGGYISIYTTTYIKTDTGNIYEISNERN